MLEIPKKLKTKLKLIQPSAYVIFYPASVGVKSNLYNKVLHKLKCSCF